MNSAKSAKFNAISDMKNVGVVNDFLINFKGVLTIKQAQPLGSLSIALNSFCKKGSVIYSISSAGFLPFLSKASLLAPLTKRVLTGLVLLSCSTLFTAR